MSQASAFIVATDFVPQLNLKGLKSFKVANDKVTIEAAMSSQGWIACLCPPNATVSFRCLHKVSGKIRFDLSE